MPVEVIFPDNYSESDHYADHVSNRVNDMEEVEVAPQSQHQQSSIQTSSPTSVEVRHVVQIPTHALGKRSRQKAPSTSTSTSLGVRGKRAAGGQPPRKRARTEFQEDIEGLGKRTSPVWNEFTIVAKRDGEGKVVSLHAVCRHCSNTSYRAEGVYGTSNLKKHLKTCEPYQAWVDKYGDTNASFDQDRYCRLFAKAIMLHGYPLSMVEHDGIRKLHSYLNPKVKHISRATVTRWCMKKHDKMKKILHDTLANLESRVSFTCDVWTACTSRAYLTLTAHYVDNDWCLRSKILNFRHFPPPHTGNDIGLLVYNMIKEWKLEKKVMCMTVDNASNMDAMIPVLSSKLNPHMPLTANGTYFHIRCSAHILNLIVHDGLKAIDPAVILVRENVKYIDSSEARLNRFRDCISDLDKPTNLKLWLDVPTRWNSTYLMLERCLNYKKALNVFGATENGFFYRLSPTDWLNVAKMTVLLEPFYEITKMFSGTEYPTANLYLEQVCRIEYQLRKAMGSFDPHVRSMGEYMYANFTKYWSVEHDLLCIAAILDPRRKLEFVEYHLRRVSRSEEDLLAKLRKVREAMFGIFNEYKGHASTNLGVHQNSSSQLPRSGNSWRDEIDD